MKIWEKAKLTWSKYVRLQDPVFLKDKKEIEKEKMQTIIACFALDNFRTLVNLPEIKKLGLEIYLEMILAHEVGHHVLAPGNLLTYARLNDYLSSLLRPDEIRLMVNLFLDLLVNDFLYTQRGVSIDKVYKQLQNHRKHELGDQFNDELWTLYMRIYEIMWRLPCGTLCLSQTIPPEIDRDAKLSARLIRTLKKKWFLCLKNLAYIFKAYFSSKGSGFMTKGPLIDDVIAGEDALGKIWGFTKKSGEELDKPMDKKFDGELSGLFGDDDGDQGLGKGQGGGQFRDPRDYLGALKTIGAITDEKKALVQYYTELAFPHIILFPKTERFTTEPILEGTEQWELSDPLDDLDFLESFRESPVVFPGVTTRKRMYGEDKGSDLHEVPIDIDLYIDTSGSMPRPSSNISYPTIAAFILALSALRAGASVQATSWSGSGQALSTKGFSRKKEEILSVLVHFYGDGTQFPLQVLEKYKTRPVDAPPVHVIVVSDDGVDTMLRRYRKKDGIDVVKMAMNKGKGQGTLLLNISEQVAKRQKDNLMLLEKVGYKFYRVTNWEEIIKFAKDFSREKFTNY